MLKKYLALLLALCLVAGVLGGCGESTPEPTPTATPTEVVGYTQDGAFTPYAETLTLTMLYENNPGVTYVGDDSIENNVITRFIKEKLNIAFDLSWQVDKGNYNTQLDLAIASNTGLPDMFIVGKSQMYTLAAAGQIVDMAPYFEQYASDNLKQILSFNNNEGLESATLLGGTYALPLPNDVGDGASMVFIRKDWLDKLNLEAPKTIDELVAVAQAFVDNDMSGRGNTIGIGLANDLGFTFDVFCNAYGAYPDMWIEDESGQLVYGSVQPEMKQGLQKLQELYQKGLIHPEFAAQDNTRLAQYVAQGRLGIFIGPFWYNNNYIISNMNADPNAEWIAVNNLSENADTDVSSRAWNTTYRWLAVNSTCGNPEAAVKLLNLWYEIWQGEYSEWFWDLQMSEEYYDIDLKTYSPVFFDPPLKNTQMGVLLREAYETGDTSKLNAEGMYAYSLMVNDVGSAMNRSAMLTWYGSFKNLNDTYESFTYDKYRGPEDIMFSTMDKTLHEMETRTFVGIITGKDISEFDKFVQEWNNTGGMVLTQQVNTWAAGQ